MKKKLLFVNSSMGFGGAEKSLQTLLSLIDTDRYEVDLFLLRREGEFLELLPKEINVLPSPETVKAFSMPLVSSCLYFLKKGKLRNLADRILFSKAVREGASERESMQTSWKYGKSAFPEAEKEYDAAIAYLEGSPIYYCADKVRAKKKIAYIHNDYKKLLMDSEFDRRYFKDFDCIVTVSKECEESLKDVFPEYKDKIRVVENIISPKALRQQAKADEGFCDDFGGKRILTMGRLDSQKGIDIAIEACSILSKKHDIRWYVLGEGAQREELQRQIDENSLRDRFILLGAKINPYSYLSKCDIYAQPSRFEGKSIALEEAKGMGKPIVTTRFTTVSDQIEDGVTGLIAEIDAKSVAEKIDLLLSDGELRERLCENLRSYDGNESEIEVFYKMTEE